MTSVPEPPRNRPNIIVAALGLGVIGIFASLYMLRRDMYFTVLDLWSFRPFRYPFIDLSYVAAQIKCWNIGIDVYAANPCDPLGRPHDYSPLWLRLPWLANAGPFVHQIGLAMDALFMLSLAALPTPRRPVDYVPLLLGVVSPMTIFAMERGNVDTLMFLFSMTAVVAMDRTLPARLLGYGAIMLASLLKFYPFVLFIFLLRERFRIFLVTATAASSLLAGFIWAYRDELRRMAANIPQPSSFTDAFGAAQLPTGIAGLTQRLLQPGGAAGPLRNGPVTISIPLTALLVVAAWLAARHVAHRQDFRAAMCALTQREHLTLLAGAVLICGCFFSGRSIGYRELTLVIAIPGLAALARTAPPGPLRTIFWFTTWNAVYLMCYLPPQRLLYAIFGSLAAGHTALPVIAFWLVREICWWCLIAVLLGVLIRFVLDSPAYLAVTGRPRSPPPAQKKRSNHASVSSGASSAM